MDEGAVRRRHAPAARRSSRRRTHRACCSRRCIRPPASRGASLAPPIDAGQPPPAPGAPPFDARAGHLHVDRRRRDVDASSPRRACRRRRSAARRSVSSRRAAAASCSPGLRDGLYRSEDGGETWTRANRDPRITPVGVIADPEQPGRRLRDADGALSIHRRRPHVRRLRRRAERRRFPAALDRSAQLRRACSPASIRARVVSVDGGAIVEQLVQPADRAVLSRGHRRPVSLSRVRRAAGQRIGGRAEPQRLRRDQLSRLVLCPAASSSAISRPIRSIPTSSLPAAGIARWCGSIAAPGRSCTSSCRARSIDSVNNAPMFFSPHDPHTLYYGTQFLMKTADARTDVAGDQPGPHRRARPPRHRPRAADAAVDHHLLAVGGQGRRDLGRNQQRRDADDRRRRRDVEERVAARRARERAPSRSSRPAGTMPAPRTPR